MRRWNGSPPVCEECRDKAKLVTGAKVYPHREDLYGRTFWLCDCGAYCGCHPGSSQPLGTPAGPELRRLRQEVHARLDPLWRRKMVRDDLPQSVARAAAYSWLAATLRLPPHSAHVGRFSRSQCLEALDALSSFRGDDQTAATDPLL